MRSSSSALIPVLGLVAMLLVAWPAATVVHGDQGQDAAALACAMLCFEGWYSCVTACLGHGGSGADACINDCNGKNTKCNEHCPRSPLLPPPPPRAMQSQPPKLP
ncbi:hypothetical protein ACFX2I_011879 [Malus domestica]